MNLIKCPKCELNYIHEGESSCDVCKRELKAKNEEPPLEVCPECGDNPVVAGMDMCILCMREKKRQENLEKLLDGKIEEDQLDDGVDSLDEIAMPVSEDIPPSELKEIDKELGIDDQDAALIQEEESEDEIDDLDDFDELVDISSLAELDDGDDDDDEDDFGLND